MNNLRITDVADLKEGHLYLEICCPDTLRGILYMQLICMGKTVEYTGLPTGMEKFFTCIVCHKLGENATWQISNYEDDQRSCSDRNVHKKDYSYNCSGLWYFNAETLATLTKILETNDMDGYMALWNAPVSGKKRAKLKEQIRLERERAKNYLQATNKYLNLADTKRTAARNALTNAQNLENELARLG